VYDTKYNSTKATRAGTTIATIAPTTTTAVVLIRYVWHWIALGLMVLAG